MNSGGQPSEQLVARSANGKPPDFESGNPGSTPGRASIRCRYRFEKVEGEEFVYRVIDKETDEPVNISAKIAEQFDAGLCQKKV